MTKVSEKTINFVSNKMARAVRPKKRRKKLASKPNCIAPQVSFPETHELLSLQISQILGQSRAPRTTPGVQNDQNDLEDSSVELRLKRELEDPNVDCIYFCDVNSLESKLVPIQNEIVKTEKVEEDVIIKKEGLVYDYSLFKDLFYYFFCEV